MPGSRKHIPVEETVGLIMEGDRGALGRAITLIESSRPDHQETAHNILDSCLPSPTRSLRIGITGPPGTGKSTLIESLGLEILKNPDNRIAILAIDPSSERSGGSILGDKARMEKLASRKEVYIRPSPSSGYLGGTSPKTHEAILLCEAAGYNVIIVETVGVGQSEIGIASMVDYILLLVLPGSGDELQGIKRGIMEIADGIAVTKIDEAEQKSVHFARAACESSLKLLQKKYPEWEPRVMLTSAMTGNGIEELWRNIRFFTDTLKKSGDFEKNRQEQRIRLLRAETDRQLVQAFHNKETVRSLYPIVASAVEKENISPFSGAKQLVDTVIRNPR